MKLWDKGIKISKRIEDFTVGKDRELDLFLAPYDVIGTLAHITMLESIGLLSSDELKILKNELLAVYKNIQKGKFIIEEGVEDVHSEIEYLLTQKLGEAGKKIHSGRSRNDQVLVDLKLFSRDRLEIIVHAVKELFDAFIAQSEQHKNILLPGYTHLQVAMPSSFGLWFGAYAESLVDDLIFIQAAFEIANQNPLGSAAGYGSSFPLNRQMTTDLLGFKSMNYNVVYAQMGRSKLERSVSFAFASLASTISKFAMDACLYMSQNFGFISLPDELTTGSSIMPHKKNPDIFELLRANCNKLQALPSEVIILTNNLPSGYFRDFQLLKESFLPAFFRMQDCIEICTFIIKNIRVNEQSIHEEKYNYLFSVEEVNKSVLQGVPFREAYKKTAEDIASGKYTPERKVNHTHEGSIGNLCNDKIIHKMEEKISGFEFDSIHKAVEELLEEDEK
ncbi:MAG: argininosuccinate lyase [Bacteroidales bacterium]|nr:argininosuccinate lyase [Bacteroidales bacterium]